MAERRFRSTGRIVHGVAISSADSSPNTRPEFANPTRGRLSMRT
jgi:hypothetical protein